MRQDVMAPKWWLSLDAVPPTRTEYMENVSVIVEEEGGKRREEEWHGHKSSGHEKGEENE